MTTAAARSSRIMHAGQFGLGKPSFLRFALPSESMSRTVPARHVFHPIKPRQGHFVQSGPRPAAHASPSSSRRKSLSPSVTTSPYLLQIRPCQHRKCYGSCDGSVWATIRVAPGYDRSPCGSGYASSGLALRLLAIPYRLRSAVYRIRCVVARLAPTPLRLGSAVAPLGGSVVTGFCSPAGVHQLYQGTRDIPIPTETDCKLPQGHPKLPGGNLTL